MEKQKIWQILTVVLGVLFLISLFTRGFSLSTITGGTVSENDAKNIALEFIKNNLVTSSTDVKITDISEESGIYKLTLSLTSQGTTQEAESYVSKDGQLFFISGINIKEIESISQNQATQTEEIQKSDKPKIELFIMSFCPYGNRAEDTMSPVYNLLKNKVDWNIHYIVSVSGDTISSLHGQLEVDQDEREACVLSESGLDKWWAFTTYINKNCGSDGSCWEDAAKEAGLDTNKIKNCVTQKGLELMKTDEVIGGSYGASGSPTLIINGIQSKAVYQYGDSEAYKQAICSAFNTLPAECSKTLTSTASTSTGGSC